MRMPTAIEGRAWTHDGVETTPGDPAAIPDYPSVELVYDTFAFLCDFRDDGCPPTDDEWRYLLGFLAVGIGAQRRGEDPRSAEVVARLTRCAERHWREMGGEDV